MNLELSVPPRASSKPGGALDFDFATCHRRATDRVVHIRPVQRYDSHRTVLHNFYGFSHGAN